MQYRVIPTAAASFPLPRVMLVCVVEDEPMNRMVLKGKLMHSPLLTRAGTTVVVDEFDSGEAVVREFTARQQHQQQQRLQQHHSGSGSGGGSGGSGGSEIGEYDCEYGAAGSSGSSDGGWPNGRSWDIVIMDQYLQEDMMLGSEAITRLRQDGCDAFIVACSGNCTTWHH
jgi:CheY-like chemotaxis protein